MTLAEIAAHRAVVIYKTDADIRNRVNAAIEPLRLLCDITREKKVHEIVDGSRAYVQFVDTVELLLSL
jgi:hypothetical protein